MWSDEFDKKIREKTDGNHPPYEQQGWDRMELLLDKHLPLQKRRRRFLLLLLPLLLLGTGLFFFIQPPGKKQVVKEAATVVAQPPVNSIETDKAVQRREAAATTIAGNEAPANPVTSKQYAHETVKGEKQSELATQPRSDARSPRRLSTSAVVKPRPAVSTEKNTASGSSTEKSNNRKTVVKEINVPDNIIGGLEEKADPVVQTDNIGEAKDNAQPPGGGIPDSAIAKNETPTTEVKPDSITIDPAGEQKNSKRPAQKSSAASKISVYISAGPDLSSVGFDNPGKWKLQYGGGVSYDLSKRLTVRAGFFAATKVYSADSTEYHSYYYPPKLEKIDANCLVYEIPVNLVYNFPGKKQNWFIAGGVSSYLMKRETYEYYYKNAWGQPQNYKREYKNENSHLFSVLNFSGGYRYQFTDRLSLMAEPYIRIPVSGIGSGKVKLNSGGVLFSLGFKPFLKK